MDTEEFKRKLTAILNAQTLTLKNHNIKDRFIADIRKAGLY